VDPLESLTALLPEGAVSTHPGELALRARDWWALAMLREARGERPDPPMAVAFPTSTEEVATVLTWARETSTVVVPRGGGSGVCGGAQAIRRSVVLDLSRMAEIIGIDAESQAVEVQAGVRGERLERALGERGLTLGHYPQSLALSTVGGWIAAGSAGQASAGYGVIEDLLLGLVACLADGQVVRMRPVPRSAAGPDLRRLFVGSEGTLGVVTEATLSASRLPGDLRWVCAAPRDFLQGVGMVREVIQRDLRPLVVRLHDEADAALAFGSLGHQGGPVLLLGFADRREADARAGAELTGDGRPLDEGFGRHWWDHRFDAVDLYRSVMGEERSFGTGVIVDTMEVATLWSRLAGLYSAVGDTLARHADAVGCHLSHPYRSGASLYFTFLVRAADDRAAEDAYLRCWRSAAESCHGAGGTVTHHHGVGVLKAPFMEEELGPAGVGALRAIRDGLDPGAILNRGKLIPGGP
jgi:alkyldihydroxyacetonephosphate synthase